MNTVIKTQWLEALRSGRYEQGTAYLCADGKYCCLGVLCDLAVKAGVIPEPVPLSDSKKAKKEAFNFGIIDPTHYILPSEVLEWSGLSDRWGVFGSNGETLTLLNDSHKTFEEIAKVIEENF